MVDEKGVKFDEQLRTGLDGFTDAVRDMNRELTDSEIRLSKEVNTLKLEVSRLDGMIMAYENVLKIDSRKGIGDFDE